MAAPSIRAGFVQSSLEAIDALDPELGRRVREGLKSETLEAIEGTSPLGRVPLEIDIELTETFFRIAGRSRALQALRQNLRDSLATPFLKPILDGAIGIFGRTPRKILTWSPKVWGLIYRDAGELRVVEAAEGQVTFELVEAPRELTGSVNYLEGCAEAIAGFFDATGFDGRVDVEGPEPRTRRVLFRCYWSGSSPS